MLKLIVNDQPVTSPICWEEVDTLAYRGLMRLPEEHKKSIVHVFSALTGLTYDGVMNASGDAETVIYQSVAFVYKQPQTFKQKPRAKVFRLGGRVVMVPENVAKTTVAQNMAMRDEIRKYPCIECCIAYALAVYLQPIVDVAPFDPERARELEKEVLAMSIYDTYPIGFFLLRRLMNFGPSGLRYFLRVQVAKLKSTLKRRFKLASNGLNLSTLFPSSISMPGLMGFSPGPFSRNHSTKYSLFFSFGKSSLSLKNVLTPS